MLVSVTVKRVANMMNTIKSGLKELSVLSITILRYIRGGVCSLINAPVILGTITECGFSCRCHSIFKPPIRSWSLCLRYFTFSKRVYFMLIFSICYMISLLCCYIVSLLEALIPKNKAVTGHADVSSEFVVVVICLICGWPMMDVSIEAGKANSYFWVLSASGD